MITISCSFREKMKRFLLFCRALIILVSIYLSCVSSSILAESSSEKSILLEFKASVSDPSGILSSWDSNSSDYCSYWHGVSCDSDFRVSSLNISGATDYEEEGKSKHFSYPKLSLFPYHHGFGIRRICAPGNRKLVGKISPAIGKLTELRVLSLPCHDFRGEIPREILGMEKLKVLDLNANSLNGELPDRFAGLRGLKIFDLGFNRIYGEIPLSFSKCSHLEVLNLAGNRFNGSLPKSLAKFKSLLILDLSGNKFQGRIPTEISRLKYLKYLSLASNNLSSLIPSSFIQLCFLEVLNVSSNSLSGEIPQGLALLRKLTALHLDNNKLSGKIPSGLVNSISISSFCVSFNNLSESFPLNNVVKKSCGSVILGRGLSFYSRRFLSRKLSSLDSSSSTVKDSSQSKKLNSIEVVSIVSASAIMMVLLALIILFFYTRKLAPRSNIRVPESREITVFSDVGVPLTYDIIVRATRNFSTANCIGNGGFGATYKAEISPGNLVAVKRLAIGRCQGVQQFHAEIQTLERVRHRNLVTLIGYHASEDEMFLIYNFLPGGNLENFIQERSTRAVDWKILHKIALDIAQALSYLHNQCNPRVLHRDIKPSNILLDNEFNAYLSDFGLSRLIGASETHVTTGVAGTFGYVAPEYAMTCRVSDKVDVYSYGVVLLELISDKKALDPSFSSHANGFNIVSWAHIQLQAGRAKEVFTGGLWETGPHGHLVETLHLAIMCTDETLSRRPTMKQVVHTLKRIKLGSS